MGNTVNYNIDGEMKKLARLQELDAKIFDLRILRESFPAKITELETFLEKKKEASKMREDEFKQLVLKKNEKEMDMQTKEARITKLAAELYQIKNNKEYKAIQQEIESIKADVSLLEEAIIVLLDEIEAAQARCEKERKEIEVERQRIEDEKKTIRGKEEDVVKQLDGFSTERIGFAKEIVPELLGQYERILKNRGRLALATINDEFCSECNMHLRPQVINETRLKKNIVFCENCTRILYAKE